MTRKNIILVLIVVLLAGLSLYLNRGCFQSDTGPLKIGHRSMTQRIRRSRNAPLTTTNTIAFLFDREVKLTSVKVVLVSELETNKYAHPVWDLVSESNSLPVKNFIYGANIRGMRPSVKGATADPLMPGVAYRLFIEGDSLKAQHDFTLAPRTP